MCSLSHANLCVIYIACSLTEHHLLSCWRLLKCRCCVTGPKSARTGLQGHGGQQKHLALGSRTDTLIVHLIPWPRNCRTSSSNRDECRDSTFRSMYKMIEIILYNIGVARRQLVPVQRLYYSENTWSYVAFRAISRMFTTHRCNC